MNYVCMYVGMNACIYVCIYMDELLCMMCVCMYARYRGGFVCCCAC